MRNVHVSPASIRIIRWIARIWSALLFLFVLLRILTPDPSVTEPVPMEDWFLLSFWFVAILALALAWRWEFRGAIIAIVMMSLRELAWVILKGRWMASFLIVWLWIVLPAILFLVAWGLERDVKKRKNL